jgi:hypothetical protein
MNRLLTHVRSAPRSNAPAKTVRIVASRATAGRPVSRRVSRYVPTGRTGSQTIVRIRTAASNVVPSPTMIAAIATWKPGG